MYIGRGGRKVTRFVERTRFSFWKKTKSEDNVNSDFLTNMLEHNKALRLIGPGPLIPELLEKAAHFSLE